MKQLFAYLLDGFDVYKNFHYFEDNGSPMFSPKKHTKQSYRSQQKKKKKRKK